MARRRRRSGWGRRLFPAVALIVVLVVVVMLTGRFLLRMDELSRREAAHKLGCEYGNVKGGCDPAVVRTP